MIQSLTIQNYALIESLKLEPSAQLNVITGETGAGKSIILGAIGLLIGKRADTKVLFDGAKKCVVEATLNVTNYDLRSFFDQHEIDYDDECIIRREINPNGKSRAFINDIPVTLDILKQLGPLLMDIHSQHESLDLGNNIYQLRILDHFSQHQHLLANYALAYKKFNETQQELESLTKKASLAAKELDYQQFILKELEDANLTADEEERLTTISQTLENAEEIKERLTNVGYLIDESESSILNQLQEVMSQLSRITSYNNNYQKIYERLQSTAIEIRDLVDEISTENDQVVHDPNRLQEVKDRLDMIFRLQKKHGESTIEGLLRVQEALSTELADLSDIENKIAHLTKEKEVAHKHVMACGTKLSTSRKKSSALLSKAIEEVIRSIGIENGTVDIRVGTVEPGPNGVDNVEFWFTANKGTSLQPVKEVASGGEFSRLIFALKYLVADKTALPTIIFDEIDTGVSGEVARQMIGFMRKMSKNHQVLAISHLPQFAAGADAHYTVYKDHSTERSISRIRLLNEEERITNIAGMIGGNNPSQMAKENAKELIDDLLAS